jgi:hypothetical protein
LPPRAWAVSDFPRFHDETDGQAWGSSGLCIVAHSFGGRVSIKLAAAHPRDERDGYCSRQAQCHSSCQYWTAF